MKNRQPRCRQRLIAATLIFLGAVLSVYPVVENLYNDWRGSVVVDEYAQRISAAPAGILESQQQAAEQYNEALTISALGDPWSDEQEATSPEHDAYVGEMAVAPNTTSLEYEFFSRAVGDTGFTSNGRGAYERDARPGPSRGA